MRLQATALAALLLPLLTTTALAQTASDAERSVEAPLAPRSLLLDAARADGALVAVGERGHVLISNDQGVRWNQALVPTRATLTGVWFHDRMRGWAVGHDSVILRTTDGGVNWERVHWDPEAETPLLDVWFADENDGFAIGAYGLLYVTTDGGVSWTETSVSEDDFHLNHIAPSDSGLLYVAAEAGNAYRSDDGGASWTALAPPYEGSFFGVLPLEADAVLLFGLRGHLLRSEDGGRSWNPIETGTTAMLTSGTRLADGRVLIAGLGGVVLISADGGRSFTLHDQPNRAAIQHVLPIAEGRLLLTGEFGVRPVSVGELETGKDD